MAKAGRPAKTVVAITSRWGIGIDSMNYSIERYEPALGQWRPRSWYGTLAHCCEAFIEQQVRNRSLEMFGEGVTRIKQESVERILEEVTEDERRLYARLREYAEQDRRTELD